MDSILDEDAEIFQGESVDNVTAGQSDYYPVAAGNFEDDLLWGFNFIPKSEDIVSLNPSGQPTQFRVRGKCKSLRGGRIGPWPMLLVIREHSQRQTRHHGYQQYQENDIPVSIALRHIVYGTGH
jgi:hypothetical protein